MATAAEIGTMEELLESVRKASTKAAGVTEAEVPTSGPDTSKPTGTIEGNMSEGARSAENNKEIKEQLGDMGAEGAPSPDAKKKTPNEYTEATVGLTGEDPENESNDPGPVTEAEPGTSLPGTDIKDKVSLWKKMAEDTMTELYAINHLGGNSEQLDRIVPDTVKEAAVTLVKAASEAASQSQASNGQGNATAEGNDVDESKLAEELQAVVATQIAEAHLSGEKLAELVANHLEQLGEEGRSLAEKTAMGELPPEAMGELPPEAMGELPPEAMGAMPPEMAGGAGADPQVVAEALEELAAELGISVEELLTLLAEAESGGGGEADLMAEDPAMAMPEGELKTAAVKERVRKNAKAILTEHLRRGSK